VIPGDGGAQVFSNLLISIYAYVGSNPTLSATFFRGFSSLSFFPSWLLAESGDPRGRSTIWHAESFSANRIALAATWSDPALQAAGKIRVLRE